MSTSKVTIDNQVVFDLTDATAENNNISFPEIAYLSDGSKVEGTYSDTERNLVFIDYDGTVLYTYNTQQALALTQLPANPSHTGLIAEGWNWTLDEIKTHLTTYPDGVAVVGQFYITESGATEFDVELTDYTLHPYLCITRWLYSQDSTGTIDWGDGTAVQQLTLTSADTWLDHQYQAAGDYTIKITCSSAYYFSGSSSGNQIIFQAQAYRSSSDRRYWSILKNARLGLNHCLSNYTFSSQYAIQTVTISAQTSVVSGLSATFEKCYRLQSVTFPRELVGSAAMLLSGSISLTAVAFSGASTLFDYYSAINSCINLKYVLQPIVCYSPSYLYDTESMTILNSSNIQVLQSLGLKKLNLINCTGTISATYCYSLVNVGLCGGITSVRFSNCFSLQKLDIPDTVVQLQDSCFSYCYNLIDIKLPASISAIPNSAFGSCYLLTSIIIPSNVTSIGNYAFRECYSLKSITIPGGVTSIGSSAFRSCHSLQSVIIPSGVTSINDSTFYDCRSLLSITIPSGVTSIRSSAFYYCSSLSEIHFQPTTPPTVASSNAFYNLPTTCIIYVPTGTLEAYTAATNYPSSSTYTYMEE